MPNIETDEEKLFRHLGRPTFAEVDTYRAQKIGKLREILTDEGEPNDEQLKLWDWLEAQILREVGWSLEEYRDAEDIRWNDCIQ